MDDFRAISFDDLLFSTLKLGTESLLFKSGEESEMKEEMQFVT